MGINKNLWTVGEHGILELCNKLDLTNELLQEVVNILKLVHNIQDVEGIEYESETDSEDDVD